ncbi:hypothetical protein AMTRI_Chr02g216410 [Amborella trichopoda]|uniref:ABC transporter G family member 11-like n=1 Tax=Amborella trichopoda TaxID=13333 RepID=UPI0009BF7B0E|nr:ABC transporter G family member 11-like [Amborella trichopoda]|eukprot:XP_020519114.1 ABC transporter G family member 11-like [Amborella trichopoda]
MARGACASFVLGFVTFMLIGGFPSFVEDMKMFQRERLNGHYGVVAFVVSNTLSAMSFLITLSIWALMLKVFFLFLSIGWMIGSWYSSGCSDPYIAI